MPKHTSAYEDFNNRLAKLREAAPQLVLPPPCLDEMKAEIIGFESGKSMKASFPFQDRYTNPMGVYQGGFICAALDNVFGPLSFEVAQAPVVTLEMSCRYIKPFLPKHQRITVEVEVVSRTRQILIMHGKVTTEDGTLIALASTQSMILQRET